MKQPIDWELAVKSVNGNVNGAKEILTIFFSELPKYKKEINHAYQEKNKEKLYACLHKLKGSCHFAGVPTLHEVTGRFCDAIKDQQPHELKKTLAEFNQACDDVLTASKHFTFPA